MLITFIDLIFIETSEVPSPFKSIDFVSPTIIFIESDSLSLGVRIKVNSAVKQESFKKGITGEVVFDEIKGQESEFNSVALMMFLFSILLLALLIMLVFLYRRKTNLIT